MRHTITPKKDKKHLALALKYIQGELSYADIVNKHGKPVWTSMAATVLRALKRGDLTLK